jgi:glycosyltransferase involved in cell wall biosynthesis
MMGQSPPKSPLHLIFSTDATLDEIERYGMLPWNRSMLDAYREAFDIDIYSSDHANFSDRLGVRHHPGCPATAGFLPKRARQLLFYLDLLRRARRMRGVIRVLSPNLAILPEIRRISGSPTIVDFHYDWSEKTRADYRGPKRALANFIQRRCLRGADIVIASTDSLRKRIPAAGSRRVIHLPNFVDPALFHPAEKRERKIVFAGRLHWAKGCHVLIEAFNRIASELPDVCLVILGSGGDQSRLRSMVAAGAGDRVSFLGSVPHDVLAGHVGSAAVFAFPTITVEGQPKSLIEALACGTPPVCSDVFGVTGLIRDGDNGLLVPPGDAEALATALRRILSDGVLWARLSNNCLRGSRHYARDHVLGRQIRVMRIAQSMRGPSGGGVSRTGAVVEVGRRRFIA